MWLTDGFTDSLPSRLLACIALALPLQIYSPRHEVYVNTKSTRLQDLERQPIP